MSKGDPARSEKFFFRLSSRHILVMSKISLFPYVSKTVEMEDMALARWLLDQHIQVEHTTTALATAIRNMREKQKK